MFFKAIILLTPPIIPNLYYILRRFIVKKLPNRIRNEMRERFVLESDLEAPFSGSELFSLSVRGISKYLEYGSGHSTRWLLRNTNVEILTIDSSQEWLDTIDRHNHNNHRLIKYYVDIGATLSWGFPKNLVLRNSFRQYWEAPLTLGDDYELVLIDGRFRIQCFLFSLLKAKENTVLLFDDYCERPYYHVVEEIIKPVKNDGRMAKFLKPSNLDSSKVEKLIDDFKFYVD